MNKYNTLQTLIRTFIATTALSASYSANAATQMYECTNCSDNTFLSGYISHTGNDASLGWDWSGIVTNDGAEGTAFFFDSFSSSYPFNGSNFQNSTYYYNSGIKVPTSEWLTSMGAYLISERDSVYITWLQEDLIGFGASTSGSAKFDLQLSTVSPVPEPSTALLFTPALIMLGLFSRRRNTGLIK